MLLEMKLENSVDAGVPYFNVLKCLKMYVINKSLVMHSMCSSCSNETQMDVLCYSNLNCVKNVIQNLSS